MTLRAAAWALLGVAGLWLWPAKVAFYELLDEGRLDQHTSHVLLFTLPLVVLWLPVGLMIADLRRTTSLTPAQKEDWWNEALGPKWPGYQPGLPSRGIADMVRAAWRCLVRMPFVSWWYLLSRDRTVVPSFDILGGSRR
jgi:hypothetical protein